MRRLLPTSRRGGFALASAAIAVLGLLSYFVYDVRSESSQQQQQQEDDVPGNDSSSDSDNEADQIEDIINIADHLQLNIDDEWQPQQQQSLVPPTAGTQPLLVLSDGHSRQQQGRRMLAISARGIILNSVDGLDRWSSNVKVCASAEAVLKRLGSIYNVYIVVVVRGEEDEGRIIQALQEAGIVGASLPAGPGSGSGSGSATADIAAASTGDPGALPRNNVLFCQTEEGKSHLVRHLLTLAGATKFSSRNATYAGYAGYIDTNQDVVHRLAQVLHGVVLVNGGGLANNAAFIGRGDVPGTQTAFLSELASTSTSAPAPVSTPANFLSSNSIERVDDITQASVYVQ
ncbi:hypothetical protein LPJ66_001243 [Kickxella alabastrina]|uniref:Uncharacterized protein n=1 Tax=Kickxella alabastrina TaxID=61397 RepID=A0ACC1ITU2_9FUNG|nr:hypothetical protein LPJ66_001243 [Kickxella alabastrina]